MIVGKSIRILGLAKYLPRVVLSSEIEQAYGLPIGWSEEHSGVKSRHHVTFESNGYMGARALENVMEKCNLKMKDIDLLISAGGSFDYVIPNQSSVIKSELTGGNTVDIPTIDIDTVCLSFISAFEIAASLLDGKKYKTIAIVCSEISSKGLNPQNPETLTLFGDGAVAALLQYDANSDSLYIKSLQKTYSEGIEYAIIKGGGGKYHFKDYPYDSAFHSFNMNGVRLLRLIKSKLSSFTTEFFDDLPVNFPDVDCIIIHQASKAGISMFTDFYHPKKDQLKGNLIDHGNCIAASIPMILCDAIESGEIKRGAICFLIGSSAGVSVGGLLLKF